MVADRQVYIVEDDTGMTAVVRRVCVDLGLTPRAFATVHDFLDQAEPPESAIVLLDLWLPDGNGIDIIRSLAARRCSAAIYLMSGQDDRLLGTVQRLGRSYGLDIRGILRKPFPLAELQDAIQSHVPRSAGPAGRGTLTEQMHVAIIGGELRLHYQPKIDLITRRIVGCEALIRWEKPGEGLILPGAFLPAAEEAGLMGAITRWVLGEALCQVARWRAEGLDLPVSVNVPADMLGEMHLPALIEDLLREHDLPGSAVTLEVTEAAVMKDLLTAIDVLARLRLMGVSLSIDDFGTGHASIVKLRQLPFNEMKIDRSFIRDIDADRDARTLVGAMIDMGHSFGMTTVGEGTETAADVARLEELGCVMAQGFYFGRPMPADALFAWAGRNLGTTASASASCAG